MSDPQNITQHFATDGDFTRPNWDTIGNCIAQLPTEDQSGAWDEAVTLWATALADDLGGNYRLTGSENFLCVSDRDDATARWLVRIGEHAEKRIRETLRQLAWGDSRKHFLLIITDQDDYDSYVSQFYDEGTFAASIGLHIRTGMPHIVVHFIDAAEALSTLSHEMSHACVSHLPLPRWLDEGVAMTLQKMIGDIPPPESMSNVQAIWNIQSNWSAPVLWGELAERHHEFWTEENIQGFWAGTTYLEPGDASELSYSLGEILLNLITQDHKNWLDFLASAHHDDAGQTAALNCFGVGLGEIAGTFLGPGEWRPVRQELVRHWKEAGWEN